MEDRILTMRNFNLPFGRNTVATLVALAVAAFAIDYVKFNWDPPCNVDINEWKTKWQTIERNFSNEVFGQHIAVETALNAIYAHITNPTPKKALVLAFHGNVGSGKTHMSQLIAEHLFEGGFSSRYVHSFIGPKHFIKDAKRLRENEAVLLESLEKAGKTCGHSVFIFDEVDKMPGEILDVLVPYMDHYKQVDGRDYRKMIFIFLSNTGSEAIRDLTYKYIKTAGRRREDVTIFDFQELIAKDAFVETGGLKNAKMIQQRLVSFYVPFLPLEKKHVVMCAAREIYRRRILFVQPDEIASKIQYSPRDDPVFAEDGCKSVPTYVDFFLRKADSLFK